MFYPALEKYLRDQKVSYEKFPLSVTSYLRIQLDDIRRFIGDSNQMHEGKLQYVCRASPAPGYCRLHDVLQMRFQKIDNEILAGKTLATFDSLARFFTFFPSKLYTTDPFKNHPTHHLYTTLNNLQEKSTNVDSHQIFQLYNHLTMLRVVREKSRANDLNIMEAFLQIHLQEPGEMRDPKRINMSTIFNKCHCIKKTYNYLLPPPILEGKYLVCCDKLWSSTFTELKIGLNNGPKKQQDKKLSGHYKEAFILYLQLVYLQVTDLKANLASMVTQLFPNDLSLELPIYSMIDIRREVNEKLNELLMEEVNTTHIPWNFWDLAHSLVLYGEGSYIEYLQSSVSAASKRGKAFLRGINSTTRDSPKLETWVKYYANIQSSNPYWSNISSCNPYGLRNRLENLGPDADVRTVCRLCKSLCHQDPDMMQRMLKSKQLSHLLHDTVHRPTLEDQSGDSKVKLGFSMLPFCFVGTDIEKISTGLNEEEDFLFSSRFQYQNFSKVFCQRARQTYTDMGICTAVNVPNNKLLVRQQFSRLGKNMSNIKGLLFPQRASRKVFDDGLLLILDSWAFNGLVTKNHVNVKILRAQKDHVLQSAEMNNFKAVLHNSNEIPALLSPDTFSVKLKKSKEALSVQSFFTKVKVEAYDAQDGIRGVDFHKRQCRFEDEVEGLEMFSTYSEQNCLYECRLKVATIHCHCVPWNYPGRHTEAPCDMLGTLCFNHYLAWLAENLNDVKEVGSPPCQCYPSCRGYNYIPVGHDHQLKSPEWQNAEKLLFQATLSKHDQGVLKFNYLEVSHLQQFLFDYIVDVFKAGQGRVYQRKEFLGPLSFYYKMDNYTKAKQDDLADRINNIAVWHIDFDRSHYTVRRKVMRTTLATMLSSFGGILGLFCGFSIVGLLDVFFWVKKFVKEKVGKLYHEGTLMSQMRRCFRRYK